ncbi:MAG TPA: type I pullulanase [Puia sp.]|nr:type I pullulanase [Puia sp.]
MNGFLTMLLFIPFLPIPGVFKLYDPYPVYTGNDLGLRYTKTEARFRIWSPPAEAAEILLYKAGSDPLPFKTAELKKGKAGDWSVRLTGDWKGTFYTFRVKIGGAWSEEVPDPYARAVGINGKKAQVVDLKDTDPPGWAEDKSPRFSKNNRPTDAIIYELHIRDASIHSHSGIRHKGKFSGLREEGTVNIDGLSTGLGHLKELGVTHIHLLPFFDYNSVDESKPDSLQYNWGYDPLNYNAPEGSYSDNPYDGTARIKELKRLIASFHHHGLRVIMDVVYNHTALTGRSNFNQLVPGYYYRHNKDGSFSNATACGNETASEMPMMRKFILESVAYWAREYHIDGFRFDLMGVHDIGTMNRIADTLHKINPSILLYGEGWTAGDSPLPDSLRAIKKNVGQLRGIAVFGDEMRDGIKGSVFDVHDKGFASGKAGMEESVKFGIVAACPHPQIDYSKVNYSKTPYANDPGEVITYCECHDNNTLWDKWALSCPDAAGEQREKMQLLALTIVLTSQGIPFLHAGSEFLRSKKGVENSYNAPDSINALNWDLKRKNSSVVQYVERLIRLRRQHAAFRMTTGKQIAENIRFDEQAPAGTIIYTINGAALGDSWKKIRIAFNGGNTEKVLPLPDGRWRAGLLPQAPFPHQAGSDAGTYSGNIHLPAYSAIILYQ